MSFDLSPEQKMLKDSIEGFLKQNYDFETRRGLASSELGYSPENWKTFAELGWLSVPFAEENEGFGGSTIDVVTIAESLGKALVTEPFVASLILGGRLIERLGAAEHKRAVLPKVMAGDLQLALAHTERDAGGNPAYVSCQVERSGGDYVITGEKTVVLNGESAHQLVVTARSAGDERDRRGIEVFLVDAHRPKLRRRGYPTLDGMRAADIHLDGVHVPASARLGNPSTSIDALEAVIDEAIVALAAEAVGVMEILNHDTVEYAKTRTQFGQPIGKFQALQFRMVDMWLAQQQALSTLYMAALHQSEGGTVAKRSASALKVMVSKASRFVGEQAIQIHGGIGTSDELRVGHYFKRLLCIEALFGNMDYHLDRYASLMEV
ncbi:MAG: acyl-CoA dehydrogenase family protein [Myxococcota bacterium]